MAAAAGKPQSLSSRSCALFYQKNTILADSEEDLSLCAKALNILGLNSSAHHKIAALMALPDVP